MTQGARAGEPSAAHRLRRVARRWPRRLATRDHQIVQQLLTATIATKPNSSATRFNASCRGCPDRAEPDQRQNSLNATARPEPGILNAGDVVLAWRDGMVRLRLCRTAELVESPHPDPLPASGEREKRHRNPPAPPAACLRWSPKPRRCFRSRRCSRNAGPGSRDRAATDREPHRVRSRHAVRRRPQ